MKKKQTQAQKNAKRRQARLDRQYRELITNYKSIYNALQITAILGHDAPSPEKVLKQAGTRSGLVKPSKASIKALKKLQTTTGVLRQVALATPKKHDRYDELIRRFEKEWAREQRAEKERRKKEGVKESGTLYPIDSASKESTRKDKTTNQSVGGGLGYNAIDVVLEQLQDYIDRLSTQKYMSNADISVLSCAEDLIDKITYIQNYEDEEQNRKMNAGAAKYFNVYRQITFQELYSDAPNLRPLLFEKVVETMSDENKSFFEQDFKDRDFYQ